MRMERGVRSGVGLAITLVAAIAGCQAAPRTTEGTEAAAMIESAWCAALVADDCRPGVIDLDRCFYTHYFQAEARAVDVGRAVLDNALFQTCLAGIGCGLWPSECRDAFVGLGGAGAACDSDAECAPELNCALGEGSCGVCVADLPAGQSCRRDAQCGPGAWFERRAGAGCLGASIDSGRCGMREVIEVDVAEACGQTVESDTHTVERRCVAPLDCVMGVCTAETASLGEACVSQRCGAGLTCARSGTCALGVHLGEPCSSDAPCAAGESIECIYGRCEPRPDEPGDSCDFLCAGGLRCIYFLCDEPSPIGGPCISNVDCEEGRCSAMGLCQASC